MRRYVLENTHKRAEMLVQVQGDRDGTKHFDILSEGWNAAQCTLKCSNRKVTRRADMRKRTQSENYGSRLSGGTVADRMAYVLKLNRNKGEVPLQGRIW
jgi:hypothetical protein